MAPRMVPAHLHVHFFLCWLESFVLFSHSFCFIRNGNLMKIYEKKSEFHRIYLISVDGLRAAALGL